MLRLEEGGYSQKMGCRGEEKEGGRARGEDECHLLTVFHTRPKESHKQERAQDVKHANRYNYLIFSYVLRPNL